MGEAVRNLDLPRSLRQVLDEAERPIAELDRIFPEGVWRTPVEVALRFARSSQVDFILKQRAQSGRGPNPEALLFVRGGMVFAWADFHGPNRPSLVMPTDIDLWENKPVGPFGIGPSSPLGVRSS